MNLPAAFEVRSWYGFCQQGTCLLQKFIERFAKCTMILLWVKGKWVRELKDVHDEDRSLLITAIFEFSYPLTHFAFTHNSIIVHFANLSMNFCSRQVPWWQKSYRSINKPYHERTSPAPGKLIRVKHFESTVQVSNRAEIEHSCSQRSRSFRRRHFDAAVSTPPSRRRHFNARSPRRRFLNKLKIIPKYFKIILMWNDIFL